MGAFKAFSTFKNPNFRIPNLAKNRKFGYRAFSNISKISQISALKRPFAENRLEWVQADYLDAPKDVHTANASEAPLLSRNNTGMGFLVLNSEFTSLSQVNGLYRKLADLETNVYKRFVLVTSMTRETFSMGLNPLELLMFKESLQKLAQTRNSEGYIATLVTAFKGYVSNVADLAHLILTFSKPLLVYGNGSFGNFAASLVHFASHGACFRHSSLKFDLGGLKMPLFGGTSAVLALMRGSLGEYLALTGYELKGADLVWSGLARRFVAPESIELLQVTADRLVELAEEQTHLMLGEHFQGIDEEIYSLKDYETLIHGHFKHPKVSQIAASLRNGLGKDLKLQISNQRVKSWEADTLAALATSDHAQQTLEMIRSVKEIKLGMLKAAKITPKQWQKMRRLAMSNVTSPEDFQQLKLYQTVLEELLVRALALEMQAVASYVAAGNEALKSQLLTALGSKWTPFPRSGFALSNVPGLRKLHPDYDPTTGADYDLVAMNWQAKRWDNQYLQAEMDFMKNLLV